MRVKKYRYPQQAEGMVTIMETRIKCGAVYVLLMVLLVSSTTANAALETGGIFDQAHDVYFAAAASWASVIKLHASRLFWTLALISMVWTFGVMVLRSADIGEFFAEFVRFTIFTGFYWWLLDNGPAIAKAIIDSMRTMGASASAGTHPSVYPLPSPSNIVDIGFVVFGKALSNGSVWSPFASIVGAILGLAILIILTLVAINVLIVLISAWVLAYAGIFFLGFGGCRWTSDMAIGYFKTVLAVSIQLLVMVLLMGVGKTFIDLFYLRMSSGMQLTEMAALTVVVLVMLALINKLPPLLGGLVSGGGTGALGGGVGARDAVAAAAMASAALSVAGSAMTSAAANIAGGAQALMAAISKGSEAESQSSGIDRDFTGGQSGGDSKNASGGESPLAQAMGNDSSQSDSGASGKKAEGSASSDATGQSQKGSQTSANAGGASGASKTNGGKSSSGGAGAKAAGVAAGTVASLAGGIADVAKRSFNARVANTVGAKVAQAIRNGSPVDKPSDSSNTLSAGNTAADPDAEVAAFRDRDKVDGDEPNPGPSKA